jgi:hypothetical protein
MENKSLEDTSWWEAAFPGKNTQLIAVRVPQSLLEAIEAEAVSKKVGIPVVLRDAFSLYFTPITLKKKIDSGTPLDGKDQAVFHTYRGVLRGFVNLTEQVAMGEEELELRRALDNPNVKEVIESVAQEVAKAAVARTVSKLSPGRLSFEGKRAEMFVKRKRSRE